MIPGLLSLFLFMLHSTITECAVGTTLGKRMMGLRVVKVNGEDPEVLTIIYRNLFKPLELISVFLLMMPIFSRTRQRMGDYASRTMVVMKSPYEDSEDDH